MPPKGKGKGGGRGRGDGVAPRSRGGVLTLEEAAAVRQLVADQDKRSDAKRKAAAERRMAKLVAKELASFAALNDMKAPGHLSGTDSDSSGASGRTSKSTRKAQKRKEKRAKLRADAEELKQLKAAHAAAVSLAPVGVTPANAELKLLTEQMAEMAKLQAAMLACTQHKPAEFVTPAPPKSPNKSHTSGGVRSSAVDAAFRRALNPKPSEPSSSGESQVFETKEELDAYVARKVAELTQPAVKPANVTALPACPKIKAYTKSLESKGRLLQQTELLDEGATVVEWLAPESRAAFLKAVEADAAARLETIGQELSEEFLGMAETVVLPQVQHIYDKILNKSGKADLLRICERLKIDPVLVDGRKGREIICLLLSVVRVLPRSL